MKNIFNIAVVALIGFSASSFAQDKGLELQHMDTSVRPQVDLSDGICAVFIQLPFT